ncbi:hypothetical protein [uncultured Campylobacter sp.]|uniref:hypothetical protein n=1 Tax=uncultured Campylobacter sp. TaxID=218934 RepID=UPI00260C9B58|nr:hypothetical protein [uncultured Campylobacter sp.]
MPGRISVTPFKISKSLMSDGVEPILTTRAGRASSRAISANSSVRRCAARWMRSHSLLSAAL